MKIEFLVALVLGLAAVPTDSSVFAAPDPARQSDDRVSPTFELADLIRGFEREDSPEIKGLAESEQRWRAFRREGKTMWGSEKWMKEPKYYRGLNTSDLAKECFRDSIFATEILKHLEPQFGFVSLKIMHDGFAELFGRDDMWRGIVGVYDHLGSQLKPDADIKTVVRVSLTFDALTSLYLDRVFKKQVKGQERLFLRANYEVLKRYQALLEAFEAGKVDRKVVGFFREPLSVAQVALMLTKQIDPKRYAAIEPGITKVTFARKQDVAELKRFLDAVIKAVEPSV